METLACSEPGPGLWGNRSQAIPPCCALRTTAPCPSSTAGRQLCRPGSSSGNSQAAARQGSLPRDPASHQKAYGVQGQPSPPTPLLLASSSSHAALPPTQHGLLCHGSPAGPALRYQWPCVCPSAWWFPTSWSRLGVADCGPVPPRLSGFKCSGFFSDYFTRIWHFVPILTVPSHLVLCPVPRCCQGLFGQFEHCLSTVK